MKIEKISIKSRHLGDIISILVLLYNRCLNSCNLIEIRGDKVISTLFNLFDFKGLVYGGDHENESSDDCLGSLIDFGSENYNGIFLNTNMFKWNLKTESMVPKKIVLPQLKHDDAFPKKNIITFQFDARSKNKNKIFYSKDEIIKIIKKYKQNYTPVGIGGKETKKYLNDFLFIKGDLKVIINTLKKSQFFLGCDSGISHLAGLLKITGFVFTQYIKENDYKEIEKFYKAMYPSLHLLPRQENFLKLFI